MLKEKIEELTEVKDKSKNIMSGSDVIKTDEIDKELDKIESILETMSPKDTKKVDFVVDGDLDLQEVEDALQRILDSDWGEDALSDISAPLYMLDLEKATELFYSVNRKSYVPVRNHTEVIPVENPFDKGSQTFLYVINNEVFEIDDKHVVCIGWN